MKVAITGVSGFIGSHTARALRRRGHVVRGLVRASSKRDHLEGVVGEFVEGDQNDDPALKRLIEGVDAVIHNSVNWDTRADPIANFHSNVLGSLKLLEFTRQAGVRQFVFVSSVAALSEISDEWGGQITETHPTWPASLYGAYKAAVEAHLKAYHHSFGMNTSAWRPAAVYGMNPKIERSQWLGIVRDVLAGKPIDIEKGGKISPVQDVADALALAVGDEQVAGELFTVVDCYLYWQEVAELARQISGSKSDVVDRKGSGPKNQFDCRKAIAFFERHGNHEALRRGKAGVREYLAQLIEALR